MKLKEYPFIIVDSPAVLFTMRQSDENSLSLYRMTIGELNRVLSPKVSYIAQAVSSLFFVPLTHEEGHRSILTAEHIGAVSRPFFNKHLAAYVNGVKDEDLISLRNSQLPVYIRLHTAGLESDYAMLLKESTLLNFGEENLNVLWIEYFIRKFSMVGYYTYGLFKLDAGLDEEKNELKRDVVGHDVYGAIRHLYRPNMEFSRYTAYKDLTSAEKKFAHRVGWRSLFNLIDPLLILKTGFTIGNKYRLNFSGGYGMAPFGDYIDQHFWVSSTKIKTHFYLRQFENKNTWFPALGCEFQDLKLGRKLIVDVGVHGWQQPKKLSFTGTTGELGGAVNMTGKYFFYFSNQGRLKSLSANLGLIAKSKGFLLEEMNMDNHVGIYLGFSVGL